MIKLQVFLPLWRETCSFFNHKKPHNSLSLFSNLSDLLNSFHPLYKLADKIDWERFDTAFESLYSQDKSCPGKPICLMYSDEKVLAERVRIIERLSKHAKKVRLNHSQYKDKLSLRKRLFKAALNMNYLKKLLKI
ncbi:hypothetical protein FHS80_000235 [Porphyromonas circumdentaria]|nr:hypothetical protein [Porphyromonas circumdentaria]